MGPNSVYTRIQEFIKTFGALRHHWGLLTWDARKTPEQTNVLQGYSKCPSLCFSPSSPWWLITKFQGEGGCIKIKGWHGEGDMLHIYQCQGQRTRDTNKALRPRDLALLWNKPVLAALNSTIRCTRHSCTGGGVGGWVPILCFDLGKLVDGLSFSFSISHCSCKCAFSPPSGSLIFSTRNLFKITFLYFAAVNYFLILSLTHNELVVWWVFSFGGISLEKEKSPSRGICGKILAVIQEKSHEEWVHDFSNVVSEVRVMKKSFEGRNFRIL